MVGSAHATGCARPKRPLTTVPHAIAVLVPRNARGIGDGDMGVDVGRRVRGASPVVPLSPYNLLRAATKDHQGSSAKIAPVSVEPLTAWCPSEA